MVEERAAVEKALAAKEAKRQSERAARQRENAFQWKTEIIPNFHTAIQNPATRELWWAGVPSASRGFVWTERIGNALELSQPQFDKFSKNRPPSPSSLPTWISTRCTRSSRCSAPDVPTMTIWTPFCGPTPHTGQPEMPTPTLIPTRWHVRQHL